MGAAGSDHPAPRPVTNTSFRHPRLPHRRAPAHPIPAGAGASRKVTGPVVDEAPRTYDMVVTGAGRVGENVADLVRAAG